MPALTTDLDAFTSTIATCHLDWACWLTIEAHTRPGFPSLRRDAAGAGQGFWAGNLRAACRVGLAKPWLPQPHLNGMHCMRPGALTAA